MDTAYGLFFRQPTTNRDRRSFEAFLSLQDNPVPTPFRKRVDIVNNIKLCKLHGVKNTYMRRRRKQSCNVPARGHMQIENTALVNDNEMWRVAATGFLTLSDDVGFRKKPQCDPENTIGY